MNITNNQLIHREYLKSPLWQQKRQEAIAHYGCVCARCGGWGNDVHHKTYDRVGGNETLDDLEVLCRDCHEAHHRIEKVFNIKKEKEVLGGIKRSIIIYNLSNTQKKKLCKKYEIPLTLLEFKILADSNVAATAAYLLGFSYFYEKRKAYDVPANRQKRREWYKLPYLYTIKVPALTMDGKECKIRPLR